jgi:hypothetical protein
MKFEMVTIFAFAAALVFTFVIIRLYHRYALKEYSLSGSLVKLNALQRMAYETISGEITSVRKDPVDNILYVHTRNKYGPGYIQYNVYANGRVTKPYGENVAKSQCLNGTVFTFDASPR